MRFLIGAALIGVAALAATGADAQVCRSGLNSYWGCGGYVTPYAYAAPVSPYIGVPVTITQWTYYGNGSAVSPYYYGGQVGQPYYSGYRW